MIKTLINIFLFAALSLSLSAQSPSDKQLAFPGADGFGKYATGGRGGKVIAVTNLNDAGPGSFRSAVLTSGARIIVFHVSGTIYLKRPLTITHPNMTIAGQSAPGDGICIAGAPVNLRASNLILRFLRFRIGDTGGVNSLTAIGYSNIMLDHCSISWATGENVVLYNNSAFTMQWCLISESLYQSDNSNKISAGGGIFGGMNASFHHNLFAHNVKFNPDFSGASHHPSTKKKENVDFRNNVIYNWGDATASGGVGGNINLVANYYKPGPATKKEKRASALKLNALKGDYGHFFLKDNFVYSNDSVTKDNWKGVDATNLIIDKAKKADKDFIFEMTKTQSAEDAYIDVLAKAGASLKRDDVDSRIIQETGTGTARFGGNYGDKSGIIDSQKTVSGWPKLNSKELLKDSDGDGIPDDWEKAKGLNPNDPSDTKTKTLDKLYTNIEVYLNDLVKDIIK